MAIYITGDLHGDFSRLDEKNFPEGKGLTKEDFVIAAGDFGLIFAKRPSFSEWRAKRFLEKRPFTTLFVDGNHSNHQRLANYPVEEWHGGKVHRISPSVIHLMRGQIYTIDEKKIFTFGGASSHDMPEGPLFPDEEDYEERKADFDSRGIYYRVAGEDWWPQEMPNAEEMEEGRRNLEACGRKVDLIITHCAPSDSQKELYYGEEDSDPLTDYLQEIKNSVQYKHWYYGHYHSNREVNPKETLLFERMEQIER